MNLTPLIQTYGLGTVDTSVPTKPGLQFSYVVTYMVRSSLGLILPYDLFKLVSVIRQNVYGTLQPLT